MTQSIIVYRNPLEQTLWEGALPMLVPVFGGIITFFILMYIGIVLIERRGISPFSHKHAVLGKVLLSVASLGAFGVLYLLLH